MPGALKLTKPSDLLHKLRHEMAKLSADPYDAYAALNAARDAYHLCDWIWAHTLSKDSILQTKVMGTIGTKADYITFTKGACPDFSQIEELCNGSKHFGPPREGPQITGSYEGGWGRQHWGEGVWGAPAALVAVTAMAHMSVPDLLKRALAYWETFFMTHNIP